MVCTREPGAGQTRDFPGRDGRRIAGGCAHQPQPTEDTMSTIEMSTETAVQAQQTGPSTSSSRSTILPVSDAERAKQFYTSLGWREDADFPIREDFRVLQFTPPGSQASIIFGTGVTAAVPDGGSLSSPSTTSRRRAPTWSPAASTCPRSSTAGRSAPDHRPASRPGPGGQVLRLVGLVPRPRRQRVPAPGGHDPAPGPRERRDATLADLLHETAIPRRVRGIAQPHDWWDWYARLHGRSPETAAIRTRPPRPPVATWPTSSTLRSSPAEPCRI